MAIEVTLADYLRGIDRGEAVDRARLLAEHPELAEDLRSYFDDTDAVEHYVDTILGWPHLDAAPVPGRLGGYELLREIGRGGMGVVYLAGQEALNRLVCVKVLLAGPHASEADVRRFLREAETAAALKHPNIVAIHEVGCCDGRHYLAMEYVEGHSLAELSRDGPLPADRAAGYVRTIAGAVEHAHVRGILHRDLKPSNVLIDADGRPHVTDFGLARRIEAGATLTQTGDIVGTPAYMPPEQASGESARVGPAGDVYALGAVLYQLITGRPPFQGETPLDTLIRVRTEDPLRPALLNPRVPADLETICLTCLEKDPARRYASAGALADELGRFLDRQPIRTRPIGTARRAARWCRRHPAATAVVGLILASSVITSGFAAATYRAYQATRTALADRGQALDQAEEERGRALHERDRAQGLLYVAQVRRAWQSWQAGDLEGFDEVLAALEPADGEPDRRGWEWSYLRGLTHQERQSFDDSAGSLRAVAWTRDGRHLAAAGEDRTIRVWDAKTSAIASRLAGHAGAVNAVAWSPDASCLASASEDGSIRVWDVPSSRVLHTRRLASSAARSVAWSGDGRRIAAAGDSGVSVWDAELAGPALVLRGTVPFATVVAWSPAGDRLAAGSDDGKVRIWDTLSGELVGRLERLHAGWVNALAWDQGGRRIASVSQDGSLKILDAATGRELLSRPAPHGGPLLAVAWSLDGKLLATAGADRAVTVWDAVGQPLRTWRGHRATVRALTWSAAGDQLASAGDDGAVKLWTPLAPDDGSMLLELSAPVKSVAWSPNGPLLAVLDLDGTIQVWDADSSQKLRSWEEPMGRAQAVAWDCSGRRLAATRGATVLILGLDRDYEPLVLDDHDGPVWCIAWDPTGPRLASAGQDGSIRIWDDGRISARVLQVPGGAARLLVWSGDGKRIATSGTGPTIHVWDAESGNLLRTLFVPGILFNALAWSRDGRWLAGAADDGMIRIWDIESDQDAVLLRGHRGSASALQWSPDGSRIASAGHDGTVRLWDASSRQEVFVLRGHQGPVWSVSWSHDGGRLASAGADQAVRIWEAGGSRRSP